MKPRIGRLLLVAAIALGATAAYPAAAQARRLDGYCGEDTCAGIYLRRSGLVVFRAVGFANYFGTIEVCVKKGTRVCVDMPPRRDPDGFWTWRLEWQGNFPDEGPGRYAVVMTAYAGGPNAFLVGGQTWRFWLPRDNPDPFATPTPTLTPSPSPSA